MSLAVFILGVFRRLLGAWLAWDINDRFPFSLEDLILCLKLTWVGPPAGFVFWYFYYKKEEQVYLYIDWLDQRGFKAECQTMGKFGDNAGKPIGMQTEDGKVGFRIEFDEPNGAHINVWSGKEIGPCFRFEASQEQVNEMVKHYLKLGLAK